MRGDAEEIELELLLEAVYRKYQYDFRHYTRASLRRRMHQALKTFGYESLSLLQHRLLRDPDFFSEVLAYFTIQVSDFFRDPAFFLALREQVVPVLRTYPSLRIWVAGCSTGEEVYSLAITLEEEGLLDRSTIYATDISLEALRTAEAGVYAAERVAQFSGNYLRAGGKASLSDYYTAAYDRAVFDRRLRSKVLFSDHSLATDSVFAEVQLVTCRNVLIYFDRALQDRAVGLFKDALVRKGYLGLGSKESLAFCAHAGDFTEIDPKHRIYQRL